MAIYTLVVSSVPLLRDAEEGWLFDCDVRVLRDGKDDIGGFVQKYGEKTTDQEIRDDIDAKAQKIITADHDVLVKDDRDARASSLQSDLNAWSKAIA